MTEGPIARARPSPRSETSRHPLLMQPRPCLTGGKRDVYLGPLPPPKIFLAVEAGRAHPVIEGELE